MRVHGHVRGINVPGYKYLFDLNFMQKGREKSRCAAIETPEEIEDALLSKGNNEEFVINFLYTRKFSIDHSGVKLEY